MQIVIDIPDGYAGIIRDNKYDSGSVVDKKIRKAMARAVVLPKDHGRLIDGDYLYDKFKANGIENIENGSFALQLIKDEPTVLEADGGAEVE